MRNLLTIWIALADIVFCMLGITVAAVNPKGDPTIDLQAAYLVTTTWSVAVDADVDNWLRTPKGTVYYRKENRQVGCATLDMDNHGYEDSRFLMADGTTQTIPESKEVITLHCTAPGRYDQAVHLYAYRENGGASSYKTSLGLKVHVEIDAMKGGFHPVYSKDVTLNYVEQTINVVSFDIDSSGNIILADPPLTPITDEFYHPHGGIK